VPEDLGIGFDNIPGGGLFLAALSTVHRDQFNVGRVAVEEVIKIIESGWQGEERIEPKSIMLTPTLVVRQSSLRPRGTGAEEVQRTRE
jgi:DNA-binding LacI/PurR family transcriptional regulator